MEKCCNHILIVEDERDIRDTIKEVLELEGYHPLTATNGKEAIDVLSRIERPCLILLDLMMPVMNGWEFLQAQKDNVVIATIPVIVVSAIGDAQRAPAADGFVKKPVDLDHLLTFVRQFCGEPVQTADAA